jgi:hypothetical protein
MNIYDIFRKHSPRSNISITKLKEIHQEYCPEVPWSLMVDHRKIYHLQRNMSYWAPEVRTAPESNTGGYIDHLGNVRATNTITKNGWRDTSLYANQHDWPKLKRKLLSNTDRKALAVFMNDRAVNVVYINDLTIPKWEPRSKTLCLDPGTELAAHATELLKYNQLVLRLKPLAGDQYELWTLSRKTKTLKCQIATIIGNTIGLGKSKHGSKRSGQLKVSKAVAESLNV